MNRPEIIRAFQEGRIGRRVFLQKLMSLGVHPINAIALADALEPTPRFDPTPVPSGVAGGEGGEGERE